MLERRRTVVFLVIAIGLGSGLLGAAAAPPLAGGLTPQAAAYLAIDLEHLPSYSPPLPPYYAAAARSNGAARVHDNTPVDNPTTDIGATLGRVLFYDKHLSVNDSIACASCHVQKNGFTDTARFSTGFSGSVFGTAHAMRLGNVRFYSGEAMFWDKRAASIEDQALQPMQNPIEMGYDTAHGGLPALVAKLKTLPYYPELFTAVYGDDAITPDRLARALAQFERSLVSTNSRWDQGFALVAAEAHLRRTFDIPLPTFTEAENRGLHLFMATAVNGGEGCFSCHRPPTFSLDEAAQSNGLDAGQTTVFKAPSLKNVAVAGHYMHDGRFATLGEVIEHYDVGIERGPSLDSRMINPATGRPVRLHLSASDKAALIAFLATLTDESFLADPRFASPFKSDQPKALAQIAHPPGLQIGARERRGSNEAQLRTQADLAP